MRALLIALALAAGAAHTAHAADADRGGDLFDENCAECHSVSPAAHNKKGPSLYGVVGRHVASQPGFSYSPSLASTNLTWSPATLDAYLANPKKVAPAGKMKFEGLPSANDRADLIAFLRNPR